MTGDLDFPFVGKRVAELILGQIKIAQLSAAIRCSERDVIEGNRIAEVKDVYPLVRDHNTGKVASMWTH